MRFTGKQLITQGNTVNSIWKRDVQGLNIFHYESQYLQKTGRFQENEYKIKKIRP